MKTFLSRNKLEGEQVAMSVPGQTSLTRFIQLPPVEAKKVHQIVQYEAKQQIPFALEDVVWDYQRLGSGIEEGGFLLDAEVGLFAMKRDALAQAMRPLCPAQGRAGTDSDRSAGTVQCAVLRRIGAATGESRRQRRFRDHSRHGM